jgi:hypothetical protein
MGVEVLRGLVSPVTFFAHPTAPKQPLGEIDRLPRFRHEDSCSWDLLYLKHRADGENPWFLTAAMKVGVSKVYWYRENGGIPFAAVAVRRDRNADSVARGLNGVRSDMQHVRGHAPAKAFNRLLTPALLTVPQESEPSSEKSWSSRLLHR